eukprot:TRINITY_DN9528_c0_g1_i1.p1 TRINITY_DN9528_c0_g1~~TRINITY_DN9528_c0_g1_i1.p1  ORF type:complete len:205 (+),score=39.86 TRINITY_DN9528_c0_g1_i1:132-746(+)
MCIRDRVSTQSTGDRRNNNAQAQQGSIGRMKAMTISELCEVLRIEDKSVESKITEAGIATSDELLLVAPNDAELKRSFEVTNEVDRRKIVSWMITVLSRQQQTNDRAETQQLAIASGETLPRVRRPGEAPDLDVTVKHLVKREGGKVRSAEVQTGPRHRMAGDYRYKHEPPKARKPTYRTTGDFRIDGNHSVTGAGCLLSLSPR